MGEPLKVPSFLQPQKKLRVWKIEDKINFPELFRSDASMFPSYTKLKVPYNVVCRHRYHFTKIEYRKQFIEEIKLLEMLQTSALEGCLLHEIFCNNSTMPQPKRMPNPFTPKEKKRVQELVEARKGLFF